MADCRPEPPDPPWIEVPYPFSDAYHEKVVTQLRGIDLWDQIAFWERVAAACSGLLAYVNRVQDEISLAIHLAEEAAEMVVTPTWIALAREYPWRTNLYRFPPASVLVEDEVDCELGGDHGVLMTLMHSVVSEGGNNPPRAFRVPETTKQPKYYKIEQTVRFSRRSFVRYKHKVDCLHRRHHHRPSVRYRRSETSFLFLKFSRRPFVRFRRRDEF